MTAPTPVRNKAIVYAEDELGVHRVYDEARQLSERLDGRLTDLADLKDRRRQIEHEINVRELDLTADEYGKHSGMSVAAMERHLKMELPKDPILSGLKEKLGEAISDIEGLEYDVRQIEVDIRIAVARLQELGGYLNYLAAIKQAGHTKHTGEAGAQA